MSDIKKIRVQPQKSFSLNALANAVNAVMAADGDIHIRNVATLQKAREGDITFFHNSRYSEQLHSTRAYACLVKDADLHLVPDTVVALVVPAPYEAWAKILELFFPEELPVPAIASSAFIHETAQIGTGCSIGNGVYIGRDVLIGANCQILPHAYIGDRVMIGDNATIGHNATITNATIGHHCIVHHGVRIGQDGFGFVPCRDNSIRKVKQIGTVIIGNNVEIGANSCIDRGAIDDTVIGDNTKIDNLVQIAHNVIIGENCLIAGQVGIAGSTTVGDRAMIGGQVGISGHLTIENNVTIAAGSGVLRSLQQGAVVGGYPAINLKQWHQQTIMLKKMFIKYKYSSSYEDSSGEQ